MNEMNLKLETSIRNSGYSTFLCSALGFVLLEAWTIQIGGNPVAHATIGSMGALVAWIIYRTTVPYYPTAAMQSNEALRSKQGNLRRCASLACAALLIMFGCAGAAALSRG